MRRVIALFFVCVLLFSACDGSPAENEEMMKLKFYYCVEEVDQLSATVAVDSENRRVQVYTLSQLMEIYLRGPTSDALRTPFPEGTQMISLLEEEDGLKLTMSGAFFTLQGIELSIASYCLARTVCEYLDSDRIILVDEMDRIRIEIQPDNYLLQNEYSSDSESVFTLYFPDEAGRYLIPETREVTLSPNESKETYILRQLMQGPHSDGLKDPMPVGASLLGVKSDNGVCTVDLSSEFYQTYDKDPYGAYSAIYSIVNTLTGLEEVQQVQFLCDGQRIKKCSVFPLDDSLSRYASSVGLIRPGGVELDINVYVFNSDTEEIFGVPLRVKQSIAQPQAEAVAQAAIDFQAPQGFYNPIPYGTRLLSISISGSVCYLDLSGEFIPSDGKESTERAAVWALVQSLTDQDSINSVVLTIEGESMGLRYVDISEPFTAESTILG